VNSKQETHHSLAEGGMAVSAETQPLLPIKKTIMCFQLLHQHLTNNAVHVVDHAVLMLQAWRLCALVHISYHASTHPRRQYNLDAQHYSQMVTGPTCNYSLSLKLSAYVEL
jgi:hypothetical protein